MKTENAVLLTLERDGHTWMFVARPDALGDILLAAASHAANESLPFTWHDAACVGRQVRQWLETHPPVNSRCA